MTGAVGVNLHEEVVAELLRLPGQPGASSSYFHEASLLTVVLLATASYFQSLPSKSGLAWTPDP